MQINEQLKQIFDVFNTELFEAVLGERIPDCVITLQRKSNFYSEMNFQSLVDLDTKKKVSEIVLNPVWFGIKPRIEILQYLAHQMVHVYQHEFGEVAQSGKHDEQFLDFANALGLMPSDTGKPGGKNVGGKKLMSYPMPDGAFLAVVNELADAGQLITWFELEKPKNFSVDDLVGELYEKKELLDGFVHQSLLHVPLLISQKIDVDALLDCLKIDDAGKSVVVDQAKASKLADVAISNIREEAKERQWEEIRHSELKESNPMAVEHYDSVPHRKDVGLAPTADAGTADSSELLDEDGVELVEDCFQVLDADSFKDEADGDAADIFIKQAMANKLESFENHAHPGQQKVVKSTDEIAAALGMASAAGEPKKVANKREFKYTCSCQKSIKAPLGMSVICGHCQLHFMCETTEKEVNVVSG